MTGFPAVSVCEVNACFYNRDAKCHAPAINVGAQHPSCDTYIQKGQHISRKDTALVGACHVNACKWNSDLTCQAASIRVGAHVDHADCNTFETR